MAAWLKLLWVIGLQISDLALAFKWRRNQPVFVPMFPKSLLRLKRPDPQPHGGRHEPRQGAGPAHRPPPALTAQQKQELKLIEEKKFMKQNYFRALRQILSCIQQGDSSARLLVIPLQSHRPGRIQEIHRPRAQHHRQVRRQGARSRRQVPDHGGHRPLSSLHRDRVSDARTGGEMQPVAGNTRKPPRTAARPASAKSSR